MSISPSFSTSKGPHAKNAQGQTRLMHREKKKIRQVSDPHPAPESFEVTSDGTTTATNTPIILDSDNSNDNYRVKGIRFNM